MSKNSQRTNYRQLMEWLLTVKRESPKKQKPYNQYLRDGQDSN